MFTNKHYILTIYEEGGFSKAAKKLYISQPSLSASVKRIEDKISVPLFDRSTSPISLTEAGEAYVRYALEIRDKEMDFERYISDYANIIKGSIKIGGSSLFSSFMLPKMIYEFNNTYPLVNFKIVEDNTKNLIEKLSFGGLDIIIDNAIINDDTIKSTVCTNETLLLAVPCTLPVNEKLKKFRLTTNHIKEGRHLSNKYDVSLEHFSDCNFILLNTENDTGSRADRLFKKYGFKPKAALFLDQQVTSYNISCTGMGISFVSDTLVKNTEFEPRLYFYKLPDEETTRKIYFYRKNNRYLSRVCQKFIDYNS